MAAMSDIVFRPAERRDVPAIVRLLADDALGAKRERAEEPLPHSYYQAFDAMAAQRGNEMIVGEMGGRVVACLQLSVSHGLARQGRMRATIEAVRVASDLRGQRLGERLVAFATERARRAGAGVVQLTSDKSRTDAHRFYERLGFKASHVGMKLDLA
jgi:ribosomal protein S18 acetylase RimI-like enzyme